MHSADEEDKRIFERVELSFVHLYRWRSHDGVLQGDVRDPRRVMNVNEVAMKT